MIEKNDVGNYIGQERTLRGDLKNEKVLMRKVLIRAFQAKGMAVEHFFLTGPDSQYFQLSEPCILSAVPQLCPVVAPEEQ